MNSSTVAFVEASVELGFEVERLAWFAQANAYLAQISGRGLYLHASMT